MELIKSGPVTSSDCCHVRTLIFDHGECSTNRKGVTITVGSPEEGCISTSCAEGKDSSGVVTTHQDFCGSITAVVDCTKCSNGCGCSCRRVECVSTSFEVGTSIEVGTRFEVDTRFEVGISVKLVSV